MPATGQPLSNAFDLLRRFGRNPFQLSQAAEAQVSIAQLRRAEELGFVTRIQRDCYVVSDSVAGLADDRERHLQRCRSVALAAPGAVISHESAAALHNLPSVPRRVLEPDSPIQVTIHRTHRSHGRTYDVSGSRLPADDVIGLDDLLVTSLARTAVDLARRHRYPNGQAPIDAAARMIISDKICGDELPVDLRDAVHDKDLRHHAAQSLWQVAARMRGWTGIAHARTALDLCEPASESALESVSRGQMHMAQVPRPLVNVLVIGASGKRYFADFCWRGHMLIGEADGALKYSSRSDLLAEKQREDDLRAAGWAFVRWTWQEAVVEPHQMLHKIAMAMRAAA